MNNDKDKKLDDLFKKNLEDPVNHIHYEEEDWNALEQILDKKKRRKGIVYLLPILSSVAAMLLIFFGWWALKPKNSHKNTIDKMQASTIAPKINNTKTTKPIIKQNDTIAANHHTGYLASTTKQFKGTITQGHIISTSSVKADSSRAGDTLLNQQFKRKLMAGNTRRDTAGNNPYAQPFNTNKLQKAIQGALNNPHSGNIAFQNTPLLQRPVNGQKPFIPAGPVSTIENNNIAVNTIHTPVLQQSAASLLDGQTHAAASVTPKTSNNVAALTSAEKMSILLQKSTLADNNVVKPSSRTQASLKSHLSVGVIGGADVNGVKSFNQSKVGSKAGVMVNAAVIGRFTVSTGSVYSTTPYTAGYNDYHFPYQFKNDPESISATCTMLDIPLNVGYQVYRSHSNTLTLGTGLSSYIMLQQNFNFNYANPGTVGPTSYSDANNEKYLFKIVNFNATYEHQISSKAGITVQPYLKLPLAAVGYSQVKLQTSGVAVGLTWNLDSPPK